MTDFELNKTIAKALGISLEPDSEYHNRINSSSVMWYGGKSYHSADYCNNWSDLMPLVVEKGISLEAELRDGYWYARSNLCSSRNKNPQRALAECLLKVLGAK